MPQGFWCKFAVGCLLLLCFGHNSILATRASLPCKALSLGHMQVKKAGGLLVIGTSLQDSRRSENQLRGRAGRQGDPGESLMIYDKDDLALTHNLTMKLSECKTTVLCSLSVYMRLSNIFRYHVTNRPQDVRQHATQPLLLWTLLQRALLTGLPSLLLLLLYCKSGSLCNRACVLRHCLAFHCNN